MSLAQRLADSIAERELARARGDDAGVKALFREIAVLRTRIERKNARAA